MRVSTTRLRAAFIVLCILTLFAFSVRAQDSAPVSTPQFDPSVLLASALAYTLYMAAQAGVAQAAIAKIDAPLLQPIKKRWNLDDKGYQVEVDVARFVAAIITLYFSNGLTNVHAALAPFLVIFSIPDLVLVIGSAFLLVMGQDWIFGLINGLYAGQAFVSTLTEAKETPGGGGTTVKTTTTVQPAAEQPSAQSLPRSRTP